MQRPLLKTLTLTLTLAIAASAPATATDVAVSTVPDARAAAFVQGAKPPATIKVRTCRSGSYYDNRLITFRVRMGRFTDTGSPQNLQMRFEVLQRFNENARFKKLKAEGLGDWTSSGSSATVYQRDLSLTNIEAAATYKARVSFRWTAPDGHVEWRRVLVSNPCKQRHKLPKLKLTNVTAVPVVGTTDLLHTVTVVNDGGSEAANVPIAIYVDSLAPVIAPIDSIGPGQSLDIALRAPACAVSARAVIDPLRTIVRFPQHTRTPFPIARCR
ncbi:MAG: hypothetical protein JHD02_05745 [Thermoleophilaceae bacterium]|nr:hypothetical protein [Thermoleophilaceae bacterium]